MKPEFKFQWTSLIGLAEKRLLAMTLAAILCWRVAGWTWYFLAPPSRPTPAELKAEVNVGAITRVAWFGVEPVVPSGGPAVATDLKIIGLYAGGSQPSALIAAAPQSPTAYREGDEIVSGIKLIKVELDHILIDRNGVTERINLQAPVAPMLQEKTEKPDDTDPLPNSPNKPKPRKDTPKK